MPSRTSRRSCRRPAKPAIGLPDNRKATACNGGQSETHKAAGLTADSTVLDTLSGGFMAGYLSGVLAGIDLGREQREAELDDLHHRAYTTVQSMARQPTWEEAQRARIRHQKEAAKSYRPAGQPWPLEVAS